MRNIPIAAYTFMISASIALCQLVAFVIYTIMQNGYKCLTFKKIKSGESRTIIFILFSFNITIFVAYNILGLFVSWTKGYMIYRSFHLTRFERILQIIEICFESIEKSLLFYSLLLFTPIIRSTYSESSDKIYEVRIILWYGSLRMFLYPLIYYSYYRYPMLGIYIIEVINISETILLAFLYAVVELQIKKLLEISNIYTQRRSILLLSLHYKFNMIATLYFSQLLLEIIYKTMNIFFSVLDAKLLNQIFLEVAFIFRLISFSLQSYCFIKVAEEKNNRKFPETIFWRPVLTHEFLFYNPYEENGFKIAVGEDFEKYVIQPNGHGEVEDYR